MAVRRHSPAIDRVAGAVLVEEDRTAVRKPVETNQLSRWALIASMIDDG